MRNAALIAVIGAALVGTSVGSSAPAPVEDSAPSVAIFYYTWYGTPQVDGDWLHWGQGETNPPTLIGSTYYPARGVYSSASPATIRSQMREIAESGVDTVVVSWWGPGSIEDVRLRPVAAAAKAAGLAVALHVEPWGGRTPAAVADALAGLSDVGIGDVYVYDSTREDDNAWREALARLRGYRVFAHTPMAGKALRGGFDGLYTYDVLVYDGTSFARMCAAARQLGLACAPSVGPGFDASRATPELRTRARNDGRRYDNMWRSAMRASPDVVTITSYNEWHEGTQIEPASSSSGAYESYDGAWGYEGKAAERAYLERTAYWTARLKLGPHLQGRG
jgi:glycoprotein endo-alpha-1,2-mannosidase